MRGRVALKGVEGLLEAVKVRSLPLRFPHHFAISTFTTGWYASTLTTVQEICKEEGLNRTVLLLHAFVDYHQLQIDRLRRGTT
jgi:hypothetical protein